MESVLKISGKKYLLGVMDASLLGFITRKYLLHKTKISKRYKDNDKSKYEAIQNNQAFIIVQSLEIYNKGTTADV